MSMCVNVFVCTCVDMCLDVCVHVLFDTFGLGICPDNICHNFVSRMQCVCMCTHVGVGVCMYLNMS